MALSLDAPIEDLKLSNRLRNVLRRRGFDTLGSLLEYDYMRTLRGFGPAARAELARALEANGFALPVNSSSSDFTDVAEEVSKLRGQMEASFQKWTVQIEDFELRIRELTANAYSHACPNPPCEICGKACFRSSRSTANSLCGTA